MAIKNLLTTTALIATSLKAALAVPLEARQAQCYPENMPVGVSQYDCPKKQAPDADGTCKEFLEPHDGSIFECSAYCEVRLTMTYGEEVPFGVGNCQANSQCALNQGTSVTVTSTFEINLSGGLSTGKLKRDDIGTNSSATGLESRQAPAAAGAAAASLKASFDLGASWSWSTAVGYTQAITQTRTLKDNCGYWTFVPYLIGSCGDLTVSPAGPAGPAEAGLDYLICHDTETQTTPNWCNVVLATDSNGHAIGKAILVLTDCTTNKVLPMDKQDPVYRYPGVSTAPK